MHWTGLADQNTDQLGKNVPDMSQQKLVFAGALDNYWTIFAHVLDIFRHFVMILFFWAVRRFARYSC